jgi:hypothetical protein
LRHGNPFNAIGQRVAKRDVSSVVDIDIGLYSQQGCTEQRLPGANDLVCNRIVPGKDSPGGYKCDRAGVVNSHAIGLDVLPQRPEMMRYGRQDTVFHGEYAGFGVDIRDKRRHPA